MELTKLFLMEFAEWVSSASNGAILLSALAAFLTAIVAIRHQRKIARDRVTFDLIRAAENKEFSRDYAAFHKATRDQSYLAGLPAFMDSGTPEWEEKVSVLNLLNYYELVALAVQRKVIDENFYREWIAPDLVGDWESAQPFIRAIRKRDDDDRAYKCFARLALRWGGLPIDQDVPAQSKSSRSDDPSSA